MSEFEFIKCRNAVIRVNSQVLGAVEQAVCTSENSYYDIMELLTDKPVARIPQSRYKIRLKMTLSEDNPFAEEKFFDSIELTLDNKTLKYTDCSVESMKCVVGEGTDIDIEVCLIAEEREVI